MWTTYCIVSMAHLYLTCKTSRYICMEYEILFVYVPCNEAAYK